MTGYNKCMDIVYIMGEKQVLDYILENFLTDDDMGDLALEMIDEFDITDEELAE